MTDEEYKKALICAKRLLHRYQGSSASIQNTADAIRVLEIDAVSIKSATTDQTPVQGGGNVREERLNANITKRDELKRKKERAELIVRIANRALATLTTDERHILEVKHISHQRGATERLRQEFGYWDKSAVYKREARALEHFALAAFAVMRDDPLGELWQLFGNKTDN